MIRFLANVRNHLLVFGLLLTFSILLLLGRFYLTRSVIGGDAVYYYSSIRSLVIDGDLDFKNEYEHFHRESSTFTKNRKIPEIPLASPITGKLPNRYPIGSAIALIPFFALGHILSLFLQYLGISVTTDGYSAIYQIFTGLGGLLYGFFGLIIIYFLGRKLYDSYSFNRYSYNSATVFVGTISLCLATPLIYYMTMEPLMSHTPSMFFAALFVSIWYMTRRDRPIAQSITLGILGGLICIIRYQDALFLLIPIADAIAGTLNYANTKVWGRRTPHHPLQSLTLVLISAAFVICLQLYVNWFLYGSFFTTGYAYVGQTFTYWTSPKLLFTLFSPQGGLLLWSPILCFAIAGLVMFSRHQVLPGMLLLLVLLSEWYLISAWSFPHGGDSFGNRLLLSCSVIFAIGLMQFLHTFETRKLLYHVLIILSGILILVNGVLAGLYCFRIIGNPY
jgi:hypothetical protein